MRAGAVPPAIAMPPLNAPPAPGPGPPCPPLPASKVPSDDVIEVPADEMDLAALAELAKKVVEESRRPAYGDFIADGSLLLHERALLKGSRVVLHQNKPDG